MADNHPTIDLIEAPNNNCPRAVYNCIEYCFFSDDYRTSLASDAIFLLSIPGTAELTGLSFTIAGFVFSTAVGTSFNTVDWTGTATDIANNIKQMLDANFEFGQLFDITVIPGTPAGVSGVSKEGQAFANYVFDFTALANPPAVVAINGSSLEYETNYRLIVEIWTCNSDGEIQNFISRQSYEPDALTAETCVDISRNVACRVSSVFPGLTASATVTIDDSASEIICLRYGEIYEDVALPCEALPRYFEKTSPLIIVNAAFQKDNEDGFLPFCNFNDVGGFELFKRFMTNQPEDYPLCLDSFAWFYYYIDERITSQAPGLTWNVYYIFFYTDATSDTVQSDLITTPGVNRIPYGGAQILGLSNPAKTVERYQVFIDTTIPSLVLSEVRDVYVRDASVCCDNEEFYFLNELGGFDTILFNAEREVDLSLEFSEFCGFESCEGDILEGGKAEIDKTAFEVFRTTSRFNNSYKSLNWLREFLKAPLRYIRKDDKAYKIVFTKNQFELYRREDFIYITIEYILSFELNQQIL